MSRDHRKLIVFQLADELAIEVYRNTNNFPKEERYGLQSQVRRAAVSAAANIVEGCSRNTTKDYLHFMSISLGSASESSYLLSLAYRLNYIPQPAFGQLEQKYQQLIRSIQKLINSLRDSR